MSISLAAEFLVSGLLPFLTISFAILSIYRIYDLSFLSQLKEFSALLAIIAALLMHLLGALTHRLNDLISTRSMKFLFEFPIPPKVLGQPQPTDLEEWAQWEVLITQYGSDHLCGCLKNDWSLLRIFKSAAVTLPLLAGSLSDWLYGRIGWRGILIGILVCLPPAVAATVSFFIQRRRHWRTVKAAVELIRKTQNAQ